MLVPMRRDFACIRSSSWSANCQMDRGLRFVHVWCVCWQSVLPCALRPRSEWRGRTAKSRNSRLNMTTHCGRSGRGPGRQVWMQHRGHPSWCPAAVRNGRERTNRGRLANPGCGKRDTDTPIRGPAFHHLRAAPAVAIAEARLDLPCLAESGCGGRRSAHRASRNRLVRAAARSPRAARSDRTRARAPHTSAARHSSHGRERSGPSCFPSR